MLEALFMEKRFPVALIVARIAVFGTIEGAIAQQHLMASAIIGNRVRLDIEAQSNIPRERAKRGDGWVRKAHREGYSAEVDVG